MHMFAYEHTKIEKGRPVPMSELLRMGGYPPTSPLVIHFMLLETMLLEASACKRRPAFRWK